jgi:hypothetical protein
MKYYKVKVRIYKISKKFKIYNFHFVASQIHMLEIRMVLCFVHFSVTYIHLILLVLPYGF